jgi:tetraacyldisaccharide 4'-kinase
LAGRSAVAFAGIGLPRKFKATLEEIGAVIAGWKDFPDHHFYSIRELKSLQAEAAQKKALLVTTGKDFVRFTPLLSQLDQALPMPIAVPGALVFSDEAALDSFLLQAVHAARRRLPAA